MFTQDQIEIIERLALATLNGEGFLVNELWKAYFPNAKPLTNEKEYLEVVKAIHQKENEIQSKRGKRKRIRAKLKEWCQRGEIYFTTLTFNDEELTKSKEERRKQVIKDLNETTENFIANIDYGAKRGREHYHALALNLDYKKLKKRRKKIGFVDAQKVNRTLGFAIEYCMKLTNHALKDTTDSKIIYCRKKKKDSIDLVNLILEDPTSVT